MLPPGAAGGPPLGAGWHWSAYYHGFHWHVCQSHLTVFLCNPKNSDGCHWYSCPLLQMPLASLKKLPAESCPFQSNPNSYWPWCIWAGWIYTLLAPPCWIDAIDALTTLQIHTNLGLSPYLCNLSSLWFVPLLPSNNYNPSSPWGHHAR